MGVDDLNKLMSGSMEDKIIFFVLNYVAISGAQESFRIALPKDNAPINKFYADIEKIGFPQEWDGNNQKYRSVQMAGNTNCEKCWSCLRLIRNNLFHGNKAFKPDANERLEELLNWSVSFMTELLKADYDIGKKANEIKNVLGIKNW